MRMKTFKKIRRRLVENYDDVNNDIDVICVFERFLLCIINLYFACSYVLMKPEDIKIEREEKREKIFLTLTKTLTLTKASNFEIIKDYTLFIVLSFWADKSLCNKRDGEKYLTFFCVKTFFNLFSHYFTISSYDCFCWQKNQHHRNKLLTVK